MYLVSLDPADPYPKFVKTRSGGDHASVSGAHSLVADSNIVGLVLKE